MSDASTLRWLIDNKWSDPASQPEAQTLIDRIVGYPAPSRPLSSTNPTRPDGADPQGSSSEGNPDSAGDPNAPAGGVAPRGAKVALIVGHNSVAKGAYGDAPLGKFEYDFNGALATDIAAMAGERGIECRRFLRTATGGYSAEISRVFAEVNAWGPDLAIEMHFNGGGGDYATMLHAKGSINGSLAAKAMLDVFATRLGIRAWGLMAVGPGDRGGSSVHSAKAPAVLTEPFFGDNPQHVKRVDQFGQRGMAMLYLDAIQAALAAVGK